MPAKLSQAVALLLDWKPVVWSTREEYFARLACRLKQRGIRTVFVCPEDFPELRPRFEAELVVSPLGSAADHVSLFRDLHRIIPKYGIHTVHVRFFTYFTLLPWMARLNGVPNILYTEANSGEWNESGLKAAAVRARTAVTCFPVTRYIAISRFIRERMIRVGIPADRIDVVYNGVNTDELLPDAEARPRMLERIDAHSEDVLILTASTLLPWKNTRTLVDAVARLRKRGVPARLILAGDGPLREELKAQAASLGIPSFCHFLGHTDMDNVIKSCDIFAHAAIGEAFGNVLAEAMSCEIPVVGGDSGAMSEIVEHEKTGLVVPPRDAEAFASALERLASDPALRRSMGLAGRERACKLFSVDASVEGTMRVYDSVWNR
jgi:glycosyltransferase involved in cell wall biosynthesis